MGHIDGPWRRRGLKFLIASVTAFHGDMGIHFWHCAASFAFALQFCLPSASATGLVSVAVARQEHYGVPQALAVKSIVCPPLRGRRPISEMTRGCVIGQLNSVD